MSYTKREIYAIQRYYHKLTDAQAARAAGYESRTPQGARELYEALVRLGGNFTYAATLSEQIEATKAKLKKLELLHEASHLLLRTEFDPLLL